MGVRIPDIPPHYIWWTLSLFFLVLGIVGRLGEWVFHWWEAPWDVGSPLSLGLSVLAFAWGASARDVRATRWELKEELRSGFGQQSEKLDQLDGTLGRQSGQLDDLSYQAREQTEALWEIRQGQAEQTSILREVASSLRRPE